MPKKSAEPTAAKEFRSRAPSNAGKRRESDRRIRQAERLARVLRILELIQSRGRWNKKAIAEELGCSQRTVYRDFDVLAFAGIPFYQEGDERYIRVRTDFHFPTLALTEDEALGQALATAATQSPGLNIGIGAAATTRKLAARASGEVQEILADAIELVTVLDLKLADHSRHREAIRTVQFALLEGRQIAGHYESPYESTPARLKLHPYRLCLIKSAWYVVARPDGGSEPRTYRVTRFRSLRMLEQPADVPADFDLRAYFGNAWAVFRGNKTFDVEIYFTAEAAKIVTETTWHHTQKAKYASDGGVTLTFRVDGVEEIAHWVVSWAGQARVIAPRELRDEAVKRWQAALEMNSPSGAGVPPAEQE